MTLTHLLIFSLATWRLASLLTGEDGPFFLFRWLRELAGIEHDDDGNVSVIPETFFAGVLSCVWCSSVWLAWGWVLFFLFLSPEWAVGIATVFAVSAGAIVVDRAINP